MRLPVTIVAACALFASAQQPAPTAPPIDTAHLVTMASRWTERFDRNLSGLLFRERYLQSASQGSGATLDMSRRQDMMTVPEFAMPGRGERLLEANVFLLQPSPASPFVVYRDVYKVGSRDVEDHTERLQKLLMEGSESAIRQARRLTDASARMNIGAVRRNVNIPTMAYEYLAPARIGGLRVRQIGAEEVGGLQTVVVEFEEIARPTLVRGPGNADVPASGRYWIHPDSGAVPRAYAEFRTGRHDGRMEVRLELHPQLSVWVPKEMTESWQTGSQRLNGLAHYDRFQRLKVSTAESVK